MAQDARESKGMTRTIKKSTRTNQSSTQAQSNEESKQEMTNLTSARRRLSFTEEPRQSSAIARNPIQKRKASSELKLECQLKNIPRDNDKKSVKRLCFVCLEKSKSENNNKKPSQTNYWCSTHQVPTCIVGCYDSHRSNIT